MASREKKLSTGRKQASASPVPSPKEAVATSDTPTKLGVSKTDSPQNDDAAPKLNAVKLTAIKTTNTRNVVGLAKRKITKNVAKKTLGKTLTISMKAKDKKPAKIKQQMAKVLLNNAKNNLEVKKNGVKPKRIRRTKAQIAADKLEKEYDRPPPVLEPILPLDTSVEKKILKKRVKKVPHAINEEDTKKIKAENNSLASIDETITSLLSRYVAEDEEKSVKKSTKTKKSKAETVTETIEDVMNDLSYLIKPDEDQQDLDTQSEPGKTEILKPRKVGSRKTKGDALKKKLKRDSFDSNLCKNIMSDPTAKHWIDTLDLASIRNHHPTKEMLTSTCKRRHSIEKFPIDALENTDPLNPVVANLSRSVTPRSKRVSRTRHSIDNTFQFKRYSTRSDSPAQILRNGKHRKVKDNFESLEYGKKRKRLCSDFSGSEKSASKFSGYESDSSFSDLASLTGTDNLDQKDGLVKPELLKKEIPDHVEPQHQLLIRDIKSSINEKFPAAAIKRSLSTETYNGAGVGEDEIKTEQNFMDNNSNEIKTEIPMDEAAVAADAGGTGAGQENYEFSSNPILGDPNSKVPEKSIILDIMKQTFNDINPEDQERRATRSSLKRSSAKPDEDKNSAGVSTSQFYGSAANNVAAPEDDVQQSTTNQTENVVANDGDDNNPPPPQQQDQMETERENSKTAGDNDLIESKEREDDQNKSSTEGGGGEESETNLSYEQQQQQQESNIEETPENLAIKENILQALGLQSLKAAEEAKLKGKTNKSEYTGTLKTVIKLNRCEKKKGRNTMKLTLHKKKLSKEVGGGGGDLDLVGVDDEQGHKHHSKESTGTGWRSHMAQSSDTAGALRKSHYSNRSNNMDGSSEHTSDGDTAPAEGEDSGKLLVIPEKASSFSIHPGRLCKDECSYCFGKFGLFDTPCHIAQMKSVERQDKILESEKHLTRDSCLCDACYRHVDRKSNAPSYLNRSNKRSGIIAPGPRQNHCHVLGCENVASNILRRKWLIKMRKSVCQVINIDLDNPGLHSIPICEEHYGAVEHLMICAMCKRKLARNHFHYLGPETNDLNAALNAEGIPVKLMDKPVVCKLCRYFASLILKSAEERSEHAANFFKQYRRRLLHFHDIEVMDDAEADEPIPVPTKDKTEKEPIRKKKKLNKSHSNNNGPPVLEPQVDLDKHDHQSRVPSDSHSTSKSRSESPSDYMIDYNTLIPSIAMDCGSDIESSKREIAPKAAVVPHANKKHSRPESLIKEAVEMSKSMKLKNHCDNNTKNSVIAVQRLGSNPCISVRQLFPGEEELGLQGNIEFNNVKEKTPEGWEKCGATIQYDGETKLLWQELQKPYGNPSSFLRHLVLLEKYFRSGDLVLSPTASHHSINYSESVQNRLRAYDNIPTGPYGNSGMKKNSSTMSSNKEQTPSLSIINAANIPKNTPITFSQINNIPPSVVNKTRNPGVPPGLISIHTSGTTRPTTAAPSLIKVPQPQKIKIPLTKNWRPNLIPIDPGKKSDKKPGCVKVISGGKPYHITIDDYNRMCAIKKSYDLKQKRLQEAAAQQTNNRQSQNSVLNSIMPRKNLTISKTATITSPKSDHSFSDGGMDMTTENSLEKLDKAVENLESKLSEPMMILPKIPKSLTVIPQTVHHHHHHKLSRPCSPSLMITTKPKPSTSKS